MVEAVKKSIEMDGVTLNGLSVATGVPKTSLHRFVNGVGALNSQSLDTLCEYFGIEPVRRINLADRVSDLWDEVKGDTWNEYVTDAWNEYVGDAWPDALQDIIDSSNDVPTDEDEYQDWVSEQYSDWAADEYESWVESVYPSWEAAELEALRDEQRELLSQADFVELV